MSRLNLSKCLVVICLSSLLPLTADAHHSYAATFEVDTIEELEGEIVSLQWRNPHIGFGLQTEDGLYKIESLAVAIMRRKGISPDALKIGDHIRIAGNPARDQSNTLFVLNALLPSGKELIFDPFTSEGRWAESLGSNAVWLATEQDAEASDLGIFRVWSTSLENVDTAFPFPETRNPAALADYPLTPEAAAALASFDNSTHLQTVNCSMKGMPIMMEQPFPMEILRVGDNVEIHLEEYDRVRVVHMGTQQTGDQPLSILGYSTGYMDGDTLVVNTSRVNYPYFDSVGIPQSTAVEITERFIPSADGKRLDFEMTVTDPATFTEPVTLTKHWLAIPGVSVQPYVCEE